jgi:hypothetical protein
MSASEEEEQADTELCPYCGQDTCEHHAISLDLTFRQVVGGALFEECDTCLARITAMLAGDDEDPDVAEEAFERMEEVLGELPGLHAIDSEFEGGPGQSSAMRHYWIRDPTMLPGLSSRLEATDA